MAPLPASRVHESPAFSNTGVEYLGPLKIKMSEGVKKIWICLYTCMVTQAIHLEVIQDMTAEEFILGLKRFISIRGTPVMCLSDNAAHFKLAGKVIEMMWKETVKSVDVQTYVSEQGFQWQFITELAPWMGGFYEHLVGVVKQALRKSLGRRLLTLMQMQILVKEIEAVVNARPLVYVGDDLNSNITLTLSHFLTLNPKIGMPESTFCTDPDYMEKETSAERLLSSWKKGQKLLNEFWRIWREEYLTSLRERTHTKLRSPRVLSQVNPSVGHVVLIKDNVPRGSWRIGRISSLKTSKDGCIRSAKVSLASGNVLTRPLNMLYPLECSEIENRVIESSPFSLVGRLSRSCRKAAKQAKTKIKQTV